MSRKQTKEDIGSSLIIHKAQDQTTLADSSVLIHQDESMVHLK